MPFWRTVLNVWRNLVHRDRLRREIDDELRAAFDLLVDENVRTGMPLDAARRTATLELGNVAALKEQVGDVRAGAAADAFLQDVRYGARLLRRNPLFTLTAALSLAIGIGANTTIFTIAHGLLFREPAGVVDPDRLVDIGRSQGATGFNPTSYPNFLDIRQRATTLQGVYAYSLFPQAMSLGGGEAVPAERVYGSLVSANFFTVLGAVPAAGRLFDAADDQQARGTPVVVLGHSFWTRCCNKDPAIAGRTLTINGRPFTVLGVAAEGFQGTGVRAADLWVPLTMISSATSQGEGVLTNRAAGWLLVGGRLKPGVEIPNAAAELDAIGQLLAREYPDANRGSGLRLMAASSVPGSSRGIAAFLLFLTGLVCVVLAIACANVSAVLLARALARRREIAVRLAIGAGRRRLVQQLLAETLMLFALGGSVALVMARGMTALLVSLTPALPFPIAVSLELNGPVLVFTTSLSLVAAVLAGLAPALQGSKLDVSSALKDDVPGPRRFRLRQAFVVAQVALSILLVIIAALFARALQRAGAADPGFEPRGVEVVSLDFRLAGYDDVAGPAFARELIERIRLSPRVEHATIAAVLPGGFEGIGLGGVRVPGRSPGTGESFADPDWNVVEPGYFSTLRMPLVAGRDFDSRDHRGAPAVAIVGDAAARRFWPGENPIGKSLVLQRTGHERLLQIVGVAGDPRYGSLIDGTSEVHVYVPLQQEYVAGWTMLVVRSKSGERLTEEIRAIVASLNTNLPLITSRSAEEYASVALLPQRVGAYVAGSLGMFGLVLASIGVYGVTAYSVMQRRREIGIRVALGGQPWNVVALVLREGMALVAIGSVCGLLPGAAAGGLLAHLVFGVEPRDYVLFAGACTLFAVVGLLACLPPVLAAIRIDPAQTLRYE